MHWLIVLAALVVWHGLMLLLLWWLPLPAWLERWKPALMVAGLIVAVLLVLHHSALAQAPAPLDPARTPTPMLRRAPMPVFIPVDEPAPAVRALPGSGSTAPSWQRFDGATRCEQVGERVVCDNGYRRSAR